MIKERYMVWAIRPGTETDISDLETDLKGFSTLDRAFDWAQKWSNRTGQYTCIEWQQYQITRGGYEILESDFGPWGTQPLSAA